MNLNEEVELLKLVPIFSKIEQAKLKLLAFTSERVNFAVGQEVCHQGDQGDTMYVILGGTADVLIDTEGGQIAVAEMKKNSFFGEIAILCDVPRTATIRATTQLDTLRITKARFLELLAEYPELSVEIMKTLAQRLARTTNELSDARSRLRALGAPS